MLEPGWNQAGTRCSTLDDPGLTLTLPLVSPLLWTSGTGTAEVKHLWHNTDAKQNTQLVTRVARGHSLTLNALVVLRSTRQGRFTTPRLPAAATMWRLETSPQA